MLKGKAMDRTFNSPEEKKTILQEELPEKEQDQEYEKLLARHSNLERQRMAQLSLLYQLNLELEGVLDLPVSAQLTANAIVNATGSTLVSIFQYDPEHNELVVIATSGPLAASIPPEYRQNLGHGLIGRAARLRHTQLASNTRLDPDYFRLGNQDSLSEIAVPLLAKNKLRGAIVVDQSTTNAFDDSDIKMLETVAIQLVTSWERSEHDERLTNLIGAGITLSTTLDVEAVIREIAEIARQTLDARFVFVALADKGGGCTRTAHVGYAPTLLSILNSDPAGNTLIQTSLGSACAFRLRDVRKRFPSTPTGSKNLRSLLAIPIHLRESNIGVILAFGKQDNLSFTESDESLASLLTTQAAAAIETTWLYQELRSLFTNTTQLYQLSTRVIQSEQLTDAAASIAETAYQVSKAQAAGIVLLSKGEEIEVKVQIDANGIHPGAQHPMNLIKQTIATGQSIIVSESQDLTRICLPLQTPRRQYGALWVEIPEKDWDQAHYSDNLHTLANQAAIALERSILLVETRKQADEIEAAYRELETTYDQTLAALSSALDARDRETEGHSLRVARLAYRLARGCGLSLEQAKTLERGAILHDIGKIGISDSILRKPGPLDPQEWQTMRQHPDIGARIVERIPFLKDAMPVIRYHQERWDGSGYPVGLKGADIPLIARIFAVVDTFDALTTERPYRSPVSAQTALEYINAKSGTSFDPAIVKTFGKMVDEGMIAELI
jgi:putative nucleotidyltransferase with HDIG domain